MNSIKFHGRSLIVKKLRRRAGCNYRNIKLAEFQPIKTQNFQLFSGAAGQGMTSAVPSLTMMTTRAAPYQSDMHGDATPELTGFRRWWSLLWPVASPINLPEADDRKMHYGYTEYNGKMQFYHCELINIRVFQSRDQRHYLYFHF
jgi:hypothetical protein